MNYKESKDYKNNQYLITYVNHEDKWFMVSTINRICSTDYPLEFSETVVWKWIPEEIERGEMLGLFGGIPNSSVKHFLCVDNLLKGGSLDDF